ncbi:MAG: ParB/RepB/Spo0J family partition protein [Deltaproteobacteria bacterium]|nr:ParB/RepB/Spo0J family partition protein [Deltaproteobacteria bacterium]
MSLKLKGLGRGIGALIPEGEAMLAAPQAGYQLASIDHIQVNPFQPRKIFSEEAIADLAASIKSKGVLQPLLVKKNGAGYQLIAGERRLRAALKAGLQTVPVIVKDVDEQDVREIALIENLQREDLNIIEAAEAYQSLIGSYGYTQEVLSEKVGKSRSAITNALRLLKLSASIKADLMKGAIDMGHARAYLGLETVAAQESAHKEVIKKGLSVRQTEALVNKLKEGKKARKQADPAAGAQYEYLAGQLQKKLGTRIHIHSRGEKGKIVIEYCSHEDFERIFEMLRGE